MTKKLLTLIGSVCLILVLAALPFMSACAPEEEAAPPPEPEEEEAPSPIIMKVTSDAGPTYPTRVLVERAMKLIEERSEGRIKAEYFPGSQLMGALRKFDGLSRGIVHLGMCSPGFEVDRMGIAAEVEWLPFAYDGEKVGKYWREPGGLFDFFEPYYEENGLKLVMRTVCSPTQAYFTMPVRSLEELQGKLVSTPPGLSTRMTELLGASPTFIDTAEVYTALETGTLDGRIGYSCSSLLANKHQEVAPYIVKVDIWPGVIPVAVNLQWFNSLPSDLQEIIVSTFLELEAEHYASLGELVEKEWDVLRASPGVEIYELPSGERSRWVEAVEPLYDELAQKYPDEWPKFMEIMEKLAK